jgi:hypothetical protein
MNGQERPTIHYSELPACAADSPLYQEWEFYRREVGRLLAEGYEGKFVLIKGEEIIGFYDTWNEASDEGSRRYFVQRQACLVQQVLEREPLLRFPYQCRS